MSEQVWTIGALKEHIEKILEEKDKALKAALAEAKEAVKVAEINAEKWRQSSNEWRSAMNDRERNFVTRREVWIVVAAITGFIIAAIKIFK